MQLRALIPVLLQKFLNNFSISRCHACHKNFSDSKLLYLCLNCYQKIQEENLGCFFKKNLLFDNKKIELIYFFKYRTEIRELIKSYKFGKPYLAELLAKLLLEKINGTIFLKSEYTFCPIPIHKIKLRKKGFDHCELLIKEFLKISIKIYKFQKYLNRKKNTAPLFDKSLIDRVSILKNAFEINPNSSLNLDRKPSVLLFDDICTTGTTLLEAYKTLKNTGNCSEVLLLSFSGND